MQKYFLFYHDYESASMMTLDEIEQSIMKNPFYGYRKSSRKKEFERIKERLTDDKAFVLFEQVRHLTPRAADLPPAASLVESNAKAANR